MADLLEVRELAPKDMMVFVEHRPERAVEVLREIIDTPDYKDFERNQAVAVANWPTATATSAGSMFGGLANQLGGVPPPSLNQLMQGGR